MTMRTTDDPQPRDTRFDTAWRAASNEEPPAALDAAILAAAHREVGAKPQSLSPQAAMRARRRWWPLAAAATVAVIAIGVVQRAGHDDFVATPSGSTVVSDMPEKSATSAAGSAQRATSPAESVRSPTNAAEPARPAAGAGKSKERAPETAAPGTRVESKPPAASGPARPLQNKFEAIGSAPVAPVERQEEAAANSAAPLPEPFPAAKVRTDASASRDADAGAPVADRARETPALQPNDRGAASARLAAPPPTAESSRFAASPAARPSAPAKNATSGAATETRIKDRAPLPVADWIALIRRLRDEGNVAEAARELAAFRTTHVDHEKLLPPDLRDWQPPEK